MILEKLEALKKHYIILNCSIKYTNYLQLPSACTDVESNQLICNNRQVVTTKHPQAALNLIIHSAVTGSVLKSYTLSS